MLKITGNTGFAANSKKTKDEGNGNNMVNNSIVDSNEVINQTSSIKRKN